jgi:hypothetical protein
MSPEVLQDTYGHHHRRFLVYPNNRTSSEPVGMSQTCHERPSTRKPPISEVLLVTDIDELDRRSLVTHHEAFGWGRHSALSQTSTSYLRCCCKAWIARTSPAVTKRPKLSVVIARESGRCTIPERA